MNSATTRQHVVIVGGGFAGLNAAKGLKSADVDLTLIDRTNHHLFQPLLYQVATGGLSPADIASPIRHILRRQRNAEVVLDEIVNIDLAARRVASHNRTYPYDTLVIATGATHNYFGHDHWEGPAPGLKTLSDATDIRARFFKAFEQAERSGTDDLLSFVVIGAGPTGLEIAGTMAEMSRSEQGFRNIDPSRARILLVDAAPTILGAYPDPLQAKAAAQLADLGVEVRVGLRVTDVDSSAVTVEREDGSTETIPAAVVVWAAGVEASPLAAMLGAETDRAGRVLVTQHLTLPDHPEVFVLGDMAHVEQDGELVPGVAPAAIQMGKYAARTIRRRLTGGESTPFRYRDRGSLATIGRSAAVANIRGLRFSGFLAWLAWLLIHIFFLVGFQNRILVMIQWAFNYITRSRSARLIIDRTTRSSGSAAEGRPPTF